MATLLAISGKEMFGIAGAQFTRSLGGVPQAVALLCGSLVAWAVLLTSVSIRMLSRQDI